MKIRFSRLMTSSLMIPLMTMALYAVVSSSVRADSSEIYAPNSYEAIRDNTGMIVEFVKPISAESGFAFSKDGRAVSIDAGTRAVVYRYDSQQNDLITPLPVFSYTNHFIEFRLLDGQGAGQPLYSKNVPLDFLSITRTFDPSALAKAISAYDTDAELAQTIVSQRKFSGSHQVTISGRIGTRDFGKVVALGYVGSQTVQITVAQRASLLRFNTPIHSLRDFYSSHFIANFLYFDFESEREATDFMKKLRGLSKNEKLKVNLNSASNSYLAADGSIRSRSAGGLEIAD